jgi:alpha-galactosidase
MTEIGHIEGLYTMLDTLLARHPGLHIDNCASGGRRLDIEMMSRSFVVWRTDHGYTDTLAEQAQTQALMPWVPETMGFEAYSSASPWLKPGPYMTPTSMYQMRLAYSAGFGADPGASANPDMEWRSWLKSAVEEYRDIQPYFFGDVYPLLPYSLSNLDWTAWQLDRPESRDGVVILLRRPGSRRKSMKLGLKNLRANARYEVEVRETYQHARPKEMSGDALASLKVRLKHAPDSSLVLYREL